MDDYCICQICDAHGKFSDSIDFAHVNSNIRQFKNNRFLVWRCPFCQSLHSKESVDLDFYYHNYPLHGLKLDFFTILGLRNRLKRLLKAGLQKNHSLLDYGCGSGHFITYLTGLGYNHAVGYDAFSAEYSKTDLSHQAYDFIVCQDVIEHVGDPKGELQKIVGYLNKSGRLSIGTPNADAIRLSEAAKFSMSLHQPYHRHILSERALIHMAQDCGLHATTIYRRYHFNFLYPFLNQKFVNMYLYKKENDMESLLRDPLDIGTVMTPTLLFYAFFGYFAPQTEMEIIFQYM